MQLIIVDTVRAYPLFLALGVVVGVWLVLVAAHRRGIALRSFLGPYAVIVGLALVGAKFHSVLERGGGVYDPVWELMHGFRYPGGILAVAGAAVLVRRHLPLLRWTTWLVGGRNHPSRDSRARVS